jgi:phosphopantothenoylcysteine decarboxylase/phosphopantothenate--cysteine ligase
MTNHSSGKMGYAIAKMAMLRGADVTLVSGRTAIDPPLFVQTVPIVSAKDMFEAVTSVSDEQDIIIKAAAVADYRPANVAEDKIKKKDEEMSIPLERTDDILKYLGEHKKPGQFLCGFSMETRDLIGNSRAKLTKKNLDMVAANNVKVEGAGFGIDTNVLTLITREEEASLPLMSKEDAALKLLDKILSMRG